MRTKKRPVCPKKGFTDRYIAKLPVEEKNYEVSDPSGLLLRVKTTGQKIFVWHGTVNGKNTTRALATWSGEPLDVRRRLGWRLTKHEPINATEARETFLDVLRAKEYFSPYNLRLDIDAMQSAWKVARRKMREASPPHHRERKNARRTKKRPECPKRGFTDVFIGKLPVEEEDYIVEDRSGLCLRVKRNDRKMFFWRPADGSRDSGLGEWSPEKFNALAASAAYWHTMVAQDAGPLGSPQFGEAFRSWGKRLRGMDVTAPGPSISGGISVTQARSVMATLRASRVA